MKAKKNTWISWSKEEVKLLRKLFPKGKAREAANQTGRALTAVRQKAAEIAQFWAITIPMTKLFGPAAQY